MFSTVSLTAIAVGVQALANPTNPVIVSGDVAISGVGTSAVVVDNGSMRAIVDWEDFSIGAGESTVINQVSNNAAILNRVTGGNMSEIYGSLTSNGKVFLINENGIVIGASGQIETGGFVASTLDTSNAEFLAGGDMVFTQGIETGNGITVHGKIRSVSGGDIFLLSREIEIGESGELTAQGHVGLGAGEEILLRPTDSGEGRISIRAGKGKITNKGSVAGAVAELKAAGGNEYALAVNNTGVVRATGVSKSGGRVMLTGGGTVRNTGKVQATRKVVVRSKTRIENSGEVRAADSAAGTGGQIVMESPDIVIGAGSLLDVSAALGGGSMFIGGGYQGTGKSHAGEAVDISVNAQSISVAAGAVLDASATQSGDAGEIVLWSDGTNSFAGHVAAAAADGKGGFAEISGLAGLGFTGTVNMRGSAGNGELLLDPEDIFIVNSAAEPDDGGLPTASTSVANLFISDAAIEAALASSDVMLMASNDINFGRGVSIFWTNEGGPGNDNALFSLIAQNNINALDDVIIQNYGSGDVTTDEGGISFYAANDINIGSAANRTNQVAIGSEFGVTMLEAGGNINVRGGDDNGAAASIDIASAQVGYLLDATRPDSDRNGTITLLGDNIAIQGGTAPAGQNAGFVNFAQIGHGGFQGITPSNYSVAAVNGDINVIAAGDVTLLGGREATSAAIIGHGSVITNYITASSNMSSGTLTWSQGDISGNILVDANGDVKLNAAYAPVDGSQLFAGKSDFVIARIGHGAIMSLADLGGDPGAQDGMNMQFGRIQGDIDLVVDGELTVGADIAGATPYDNYFVASTIGHGGTSVVYMIDAFGDPREGVTNITHGDIRGFDTGADENSDVDYSTGITISAGSTLVQAREVANQGGDDNVIRSQIGHSLLTYADVAGSGATSDGAQSITVSEGRITGDITVYDTDNTDAKGVMLDASILPGADFAVDYDSVVARIGHGTGQYITGAPGMPVSGRNGTNVTIVQAHILGADILIDTKSQGTVTTSDDAIEANDQDVTIKTSIAAALTGALDNTAIAQIGHGGDTRIATGDGGSSTLGDFDAGNGGDIAIARGTVWDGGLTANDTSTDFRETNSTDITVFSSNQIIVDSDTAAALAAAERNTSLSQIGHGFNMSLTTGAGGNAGLNAGSGGTGGDVLVFQGVDARDYGLAEGFDDHARGTRGNIALRADAATGAAGTYAIEVNSKDASALAATNFNSDYSQIGHSDLIEIVTGNGGNGTQADGTGPDNEGDLRLVAGADQLNAAGGRGGHIDVQLGRVRAGQAGIGIERSGGANAADTDLSQGVMLTEGDISITAYGAVLVESTVANALSPAFFAQTESVIGHGMRILADSGNGGDAGSGNFQASEASVLRSEMDGEEFLSYADPVGSNRGGNGGDVRITSGDITDRFVDGNNIRHDTDADNANGSTIRIVVSDVLGSTLADSLIVRSQVLAGLAEGNADVNALIGHHVRLFAEAGHGGDGGSSNTEFDADGNSLFDTGLPSASGSGNDRTPGQAGAVYIQPNSSGGRGGDALLVNGNIKGDIVILADRRVTVETAAGHGVSSLVTSRIGHSTALFAATQRGGDAGSLYEAPDTGATYDGGIVNVNGADSAGNASPASFGHILIDGNQDDEFNLAGNGDANSTNGEDGIAVTEGDIENRTGSTFDSIASDPRLGQSLEGSLPNNTTGVIFHDEEADPQFIIDPSTGLFVANNAANNATYANDPVNLGRYGRLVEVYDGYTDENFGDKSMRVFVDMDQDGDVDLVDFDRDGRLDIVDIDGDGRMDQIDGRANYVGYFNTNEITGLGVLDYAAVSGQGFDANELEGGWTLRNELATSNLIAAYNGIKANRFTSLVGDFSNANGGRGGDAYTQVGYSSGDISITTGDNDLGEATSLVVSVNLLDDPVAGGDDDQHTAAIGHGAYQFSDAAAQVEMYRTGRVGSDGDVLQDPADGGSAGNFAINASGGRGGDAYVVQGELRDNNPDRDANDSEVDHLVGNIFINTPNALNGGQASPYAKRIDITAFVDNDYGSNFANAAIGHGSNAFAYGGSGGSGASYGSPTGPDDSSQTEIANGGNGGDASVIQHHIKGAVTVMTGADDGDGTGDVSLILKAENGAAVAVAGNNNVIISQIGHGRRATATGGAGGNGDDAQWFANGGNGGNATIVQNAIIDTPILIDLVDPDNGYFGNGMLVSATDFHDADDITRAQVGNGDMAIAIAGQGGNGTPQWEVNEQRNQTANGGNGGGASISQAGYNNDITLDIGHNALAGWALEIIASEANILDGADDHTLSTVGHGGHAFAIGGSGGNGGLEGAVNSLQTGLDPNLVDSDYNYDGSQQDGDTPYAIDAENAFHLGTDRRGGNGGTATVAMNVGGTGATLGGRGSLDYGVNSDGADITIQTNDASGDFEAGYDGIYIHTLAGPGSNQNSAMHVNAAIVGHHGFGEATGGTGGNGIDSSLASTISEGDGGDGGSGNVLMGAIRGNVEISNIGNVFGSFIRVADELDDSGDDKSTNIVIEATGGTISDSIANRAEARAGHFTQVRAYGGLGGNASSEAGAPPSFPASISAQGGDGGDAFTSQGQLEGDISVMAENSVIVRAMDGMISPQVTVAAIGHRETAAAYAGTGGLGGTAAAEQNAQSIYFIYEALREFHARGNDFSALSTFEQKLVAPFVDYFENKPGELEVFLDRLVGDEAGVIANNARDDNGVLNPLDNSRDYTIPVLTSGTGHVPGSNDGEIETMLHILAASGHGGNAVVRQGSESLGGAEGILAASGDITVTAYSYDLSDASRGYIQLASADALASGMMLTHLGHQAEVYGAIAGNGQNLSGANADANGIGGDGGDAIADQYALNGNINVNSAHKITIQAMDVSPDAQEVRSYVGHRLNIGSDYTGYRAGFVIASGNGGGETDDAFDDGRNGNGGDVYVWQRGVVSGSQRGDEGRYGTEIQLAALEDADDDISVTIEALAVGPTAPDVETHIGHDMLLASAKAGDAGRQGALTGPAGASEGLLEGNGGDIFITQTDLGADIDIVGRDAIAITSQTSTSGGNWANLTIGHQRTIGESSDSDNPRSGLIIAGAGGDAHVEDVNASDLANADAAAEGFLEDADSGRIEIVLGKITDSREEADDQRLITITSITEDVDILSQTALGTSHLEIGNQQHVIASTGEAGDYIPNPFDQTAGDSGGIYIARDTISGDILIQALDADRANSSAPAEGKQVTIRTVTAIGNATLQIGHETEFYATTGRSGFGETREYLRSALFAFATLTAPGTVADTVAGQATMAGAQNAVEDMEDLVRALELAYRYADRFPASDVVADANDAGDLLAALNAAKAQLAAAKAALANIGNGTGEISAETAIGQVQQSAALVITAGDDFAVVLSTIPQAGSLVADHADAGDIVYGSLAPRSTEYGIALTLGYEADASALPAQVRDTGAVGGNIDLLSGRYTGVVSNWRDQSVVGNDAIVANNFGGSGFTTADDLHDGVVLIEATANVGTVLTEIGHRRSMTNTTGLGGGDTNAAPEEGGVAGDGGSIASNNTTSGDVFVRAEEVVVTLGGSAGVSEIHLLHSDSLSNTAGWSDIQSLVGNGGDITNATTVSGMVSIEAERIASAVDAQDRTLLATGLANSYLHLGQQVTTLNRSNSDPVEPANLGDSQDNLGSNRGGRIISSQTISGANATLVSIELDVNGDGIEGDLIIETNGAADSRIRLGNSGDAGPGSPVQTPEKSRAAHTGFSGTNNDDGAAVTLTQDVTGDIRISQVEDLAVRALGAAANDIWIGHAAIQWGQSGEINAADGTPQYGELVRVSQLVSADIVFTPWSSFEATIGAASTADLLIGHLAWQVGLSADDSGEPSDFDVNDNGASRAGVNDSFVRPDVLASQIVDGDLSITTGEILLDNQNIQTLRVGHQAYHEASVDGDKTGVSSATNVNNFFQGKPSGFVNAISVINSDGSDIRFTATGATGQVDTVLVATNGTQGDITLQNTVNAGTVQVGHRSVSKMSDGPIIAEGFYQTLQAIGSYVDADGDREVDDTGNSVIAFDAAQDIELLDLIGGTVQVGHYITETADLQAFPVATNDADGIVLAPRLTDNDSRLRQIVGSDILFGSNANQGSGGVGTGGAGNNLVMISTGGRVMIGHMSPDSNQWQVEGGVGSITDQVLDGDIIVEAGTDAGVDLPNGAAPGAGGSENGQGDDITLDATAGGVVRIGHNQANAVEGIANETQISAGDIWVRAGGDLHVLAAGIGHENYDFGSVPVSTATSSPEGLAAGIRDRIRGNTTIGAGQNSAQEDSTLQANVMLFDGAAGPVQVNSGYGGIADRDVDGELRFFLPAQEGLTIVGPVAFNDSGSNGDPVTDRSADPTNVFEGTGGLNHEHYFALMANGRDYTDEFIGLGNFTFYFEEPPTSNRTVLDYYSPYIDGYDFDNGFSVIYRDGTSGSAVNSGVVASGNVVGTGSNNFSCGNEAEPDAAQQPDLEQACTEIIESYEGQNSGFGSNSQFPGTAGGNQAFQPIDNLGSLPEGPGSGDVSAYRIEMPLQARVADTAINFASLARTAPIQAVVAPQVVITHRDGPVVMPALQIALPGTELAYSAFAGASGAAPFPFQERTYGEYLRGGEAAELQIKRIFGPVLSAATPASVYQADAL